MRSALAAAVVVAAGADVVVVGSTALVLHGYQVMVRDLDLVPAPDPDSLTQLREALAALVVRSPVPSVGQLHHAMVVSLATSFGPVDLLLELGRIAHDALHSEATLIDVAGIAVPVASAAAALALHLRFMDPVTHG